MNCVSLWVTLGSLLAYEDDFGAILRSLRHHFWHVKATLESLFAYDDDFVATLGSFCVHFWHVRAALGAFGRHFGVTLGALAAYGNDFGVTLGSFWGQFGYLWVTLRHLMVTLQSLWSHFGYVKDRFRKTLIFPTDFNDFIKPLGEFFRLKDVKIPICSERHQ